MPIALWILVSGLDDFFVGLVYLATRRRGAARKPAPAAMPPQRLAILLPCWQEYRVIAEMLEHNLAAIEHPSFDFFVGAYPNDPLTARAVREVGEQDRRVHLILCPHDGPTSKADCLNWIYRGIEEYEQMHAVRRSGGIPCWLG